MPSAVGLMAALALASCVFLSDTVLGVTYETCGPSETYPAGTKVCIQPAPCACPTKDPVGYGCYTKSQYHCNSQVGLTDQLLKYPDDAGKCGSGPNLVQNGGFETGNFTDWTIENNRYTSRVVADSHSGTYAAALTSPTDAYLIQVINTPATPCTLSFFLKGFQPRPSSAYFRAAIEGPTPDIIPSATLSAAGPTYQSFTGTFTGYGQAKRLIFPYKWGDYSGNYWALDDVSVTCELA